jgi:hypothetical protein
MINRYCQNLMRHTIEFNLLFGLFHIMSGLDTLIARSLNLSIHENLDKGTLDRLEQRLLEKYGINIMQSLEDFSKFDTVLREIFDNGAEDLEKQLLDNVVKLEENKLHNQNWIEIKNPILAKIILELFGDADKKNILNTVLDEPKIISDILEITKISQTSGYRKINYLIDAGLLTVQGFAIMRDGKKVNKYKSIFENIIIHIEKNKVTVKVLLAKESIEKSSVIQTVQCK